MRASVSQSKTNDSTSLQWYRLVFDVLGQERKGSICFSADTSIQDTSGEESTSLARKYVNNRNIASWMRIIAHLDMFLRRVGVFVDVTEANIGVPQQAETQTCSSTHHTVILVLVNPTITLVRLNHELVITESGINKRVDESTCKIPSCGVYGRCRP